VFPRKGKIDRVKRDKTEEKGKELSSTELTGEIYIEEIGR